MPRKNRQRNQRLIVGGVLAVMAVGVGVAAWSVLGEKPSSAVADQADEPASNLLPVADPSLPNAARQTGDDRAVGNLIDDDGQTLWGSPTDGRPVGLEYLPLDCQMVLHLRPAELLAVEQAELAVRSLGPSGGRLWSAAEQSVGLPLDEVAGLTIGVRPGPSGELEATLVVEPVGSSGSLSNDGWSAAEHTGVAYSAKRGWGRLVIEEDAAGRFVVAPLAALHEIIDVGGAPPPLRREMEQLLGASDADRHASLLVAPSFLFTGGKALFAGSTQALRGPLFDLTPDDLRATLLSVHWSGEGFYWELRAASAETPARRLARSIKQRIERWPDDVQLAVLETDPLPYGRQVVARLPRMLSVLAAYSRRGVEGRHALVNGYLPAAGGHNLLLAAELLLAQQSAGGGFSPASGGTIATVGPTGEKSLAEKLAQPVSVAFARDTLEQAVRYLSDEMDVPIVILGGDLRLEGITKNQSFGLDALDQPAEEVLLAILTRANPDKTATGPTDPKQRLVYVVREESNDDETIYITTRAAAEKRREPLPTIFTRE